MASTAGVVVVVAALALISACSAGGVQTSATPMASIGAAEGSLRLVSLPGYVEDGSTDVRVDWVGSFEKRTGCKVSFTQVTTGSQLVQKLESGSGGNYDGAIAPADVGGQLIADHAVAPLNTQLLTGYTAIDRRLRTLSGVASGGKAYGVPFVWTPYTLGYNSSSVTTAPAGWGAVYNPSLAASHAGKISLPDSPFTLAQAALYLRAAQPGLQITNPYELTAKQLDAAVGLLRGVRTSDTQYWSSDPGVVSQFATGAAVLGSVLPRNVDALAKAGQPVASASPSQGTTGEVDSWMMGANPPDPNCMYQWLNWSVSEFVQRLVAAWLGVAPANPAACDALGSKFCGAYHADDPAYLDNVAFQQLPVADCGNGKKNCMTLSDWQNAWARVRS
jgi:putative spermidine/putrescine transport system substrate-binding protein